MFLIKVKSGTDKIARSLLQKAVRRGGEDLVRRTVKYLIKIGDFNWLRNRLAVITYEECWPYGLDISFENDENKITSHFVNITNSVKNKNVAGLGVLAYTYSEGDSSVLRGDSSDNDIIKISSGIQDPEGYWSWIDKQVTSSKQEQFVANSKKSFSKAGWPWDKAFVQSAAYLAVKNEPIKVQKSSSKLSESFPLWVGIDKHTDEGKKEIKIAARIIGCNVYLARWLSFYFEGAKCNEIEHSPWWEREIEWRMKKLGLTVKEGKKVWAQLRPLVKKNLATEEKKLRNKLY